jgi:very-short-patch-repair endonuclease
MASNKARLLRRSATEAEQRLWAALRDRRLEKYKFRRQYPIGHYIVDFACTKHRLVVEVDGGQHADSAADPRRTAWLESRGWRVIRFWNNEVLTSTRSVAEAVVQALEANRPSPSQPSGPGPSLSRDAGEGQKSSA